MVNWPPQARLLSIVNPDSERPANRSRNVLQCHDGKAEKNVTKGAKAGGFVVGRARFAKICAVEGIHLTPAMEKRAAEAGRKGLTADEYRRTIVSSYRKD